MEAVVIPTELLKRARQATNELRDAARTGMVIEFHRRDPLVVAIHAALDAYEVLVAHTEGQSHADLCAYCEHPRDRHMAPSRRPCLACPCESFIEGQGHAETSLTALRDKVDEYERVVSGHAATPAGERKPKKNECVCGHFNVYHSSWGNCMVEHCECRGYVDGPAAWELNEHPRKPAPPPALDREALTSDERAELDRILAGVMLPTFTKRECEIAAAAVRATLALLRPAPVSEEP